MAKAVKKNCAWEACGVEFTSPPSAYQKFCSNYCKSQDQIEKASKKYITECANPDCQDTFRRPPSSLQRFCSRKCSGEVNRSMAARRRRLGEPQWLLDIIDPDNEANMSKPDTITVNISDTEVATIPTIIRYNEKKLEMTAIYYNHDIQIDPDPTVSDGIVAFVRPPGSKDPCWQGNYKGGAFQQAIKESVIRIRQFYAVGCQFEWEVKI